MRKELIAWLKSRDGQTLPIDRYNAAIAWLEKQGETFTKKDVDDAYLRGVSDAKQELGKQVEKVKYHDVCDECVRQPTCQSDCFLQQGEQTLADWSKEDEAMFESCINVLQTSDGYDTINVKWLNSLKDRVH